MVAIYRLEICDEQGEVVGVQSPFFSKRQMNSRYSALKDEYVNSAGLGVHAYYKEGDDWVEMN